MGSRYNNRIKYLLERRNTMAVAKKGVTSISPDNRDAVFGGFIPDGITDTDVKVGSVANGTVTEYGNKYQHVSTIKVTAFTQAIAGAALSFGKKIYDFPEGIIKCTRAVFDVNMIAPTDTIVGEIGLGTVVGSGANATLGAVGATAEDIVDGFATTEPAASPGADTQAGKEAEAGQLDGTSTAKDLYLNFAATWTATESLTISGTVTLFWEWLGDY